MFNIKKAFTLIEMMVVITILGTVMTMIILTFKNSSTRDLEITSQQVKTALEEAMSLSLGPRESDLGNLNGYGVHFENTGGTGWTCLIYANKNNNNGYQSGRGGDIPVKTVDFKKNIIVSEIKDSANPATRPNQFYVFFGIPQDTADASAEDPAIPYDRTFSFNGKNYASSPAVEYGDITFGTVSPSAKRTVRVDVITGSITIP